MKIGELFLELGIKGGEKAKRTLDDTEKGFDGLKNKGIATKAAIIGVLYGLERLTGAASQVGMDLHKFNVTTGLSTEALQKWQFAAMKFDVTGEEMRGTIRGIQQAIADMRLGKGAPEAMGLVGIDTKRADDTFYVLEKIQKFSKSQPPAIASQVLKSFGISDNMFQFLRTARKEDFSLGDRIISRESIERLRKINIAWKEIWFDLKTIGIKAVSDYGETTVTDLAKAIKLIREFSSWIGELIHGFKGVEFIMAGLVAYFSPITAAVYAILKLFAEIQKFRENGGGVFGKEGAEAKERLAETGGIGGTIDRLKNNKMDILKSAVYDVGSAFRGVGNLVTTGSFKGDEKPVTVTNTFNINGNVDDVTRKKMVSDFERAARQMPKAAR